MASIAALTVAIDADLSGLEAGLSKAEGRVGGFGDKLGSIAAGFGALFAVDKIAEFGEAVFSTTGDLQALEKGFAATYKGSENLSVALAKVKDLAKLPGLGLKEALQGATNLQAAGFSADLATRALGAFGNALATVGRGKADLDGVGLALGQIASKGKISAEEINQLAERVPQIRAAMQAAFGTADTEALQKAKISATDFVEGVTRELEKLPQVTGGLNNAFENFSDATTTTLSKLGTSLNNAFDIEGLVNKASGVLAELGDAFTALEPTFRSIGAYFSSTGEGGLAFADLSTSVRETVGEFNNLFNVLNGGENSVGFFKGLVQELAGGLKNISDIIGGVVGTITRALSGDFVNAEKEAQRALDGLTNSVKNFFGVSQQRSAGFSDFFKEALNPVAVDYFGDELTKATDAVAKLAVAVETKAEKALAKLRAELRVNGEQSILLGSQYDFIGERQKILESGVKSLLQNGFSPASAVVRKFAEELKGLNDILGDNAQLTQGAVRGLNKLQDPNTQDELGNKLKRNPLDGSYSTGKEGDRPKELQRLPAIDTTLARQSLTSFEKFTLQFKVGLQKSLEGLAGTFGNAFAGVATGVGQALADGQDAMTAFGDGLLTALGQIIVQFGEKLILLGIGNIAAQNYAVGAAQLVAGGLLVGAGAFVGASGGGGGGGGGASSGGGGIASAPRSNFTPTQAPNAERTPATQFIHVIMTAKGSDLANTLVLETDRLGRVRGR